MGIIGPSSTPPTRPSSTSIPTRNNIHGSSPRLRSDTLTAAEKTSFFGSGGGGSSGQENNARQYTIMPKKKYVSEIFNFCMYGLGYMGICENAWENPNLCYLLIHAYHVYILI